MRLVTFLLLVTLVIPSCMRISQSSSSGRFGPDGNFTSRGAQKAQLNSYMGGDARQSVFSRGSNQLINNDFLSQNDRSTKAEIRVVNDRKVEISLVNASVEAAAQAVLADALGLKYVIGEGVQGQITIQSTGPVSKSVLLELFEAALASNDARISKKGEVVTILRGSSGSRTFRSANSAQNGGATIVVAPLRHISATQMATLLEPLTEEGLNVVTDRSRNLLLLSGPTIQLEASIDALNLFDVDVLRGKSIGLVRLESAEPQDIAEELTVIFENREGGMLEGVIEFVPNNRLNSVLIITSRSQYLNDAQKWIRELDRSASATKRTTEIYALKNRDATEIAKVLDQLLGEIASTSSGEQSNESSAGARSRVAADTERNALIVRALRSEHVTLRRLLSELDSAPHQVLLEATIAEVTLNDEVSLGVRWFFGKSGKSSTFTDATNGSIAANFPGFSSVFSTTGVDAVLSALAGVTDVKIISSPTLMVLDNKEAVLQIGDQVPVATRTSQGTGGPNAPIVTNVEYRDTGVILRVRPQIGASGRVSLEISQEVSDVTSTKTSGIDSPTIRQRQISTSVVLTDGATLALGGLVQESNSRADSKVPGAGDFPVLGALFRNRDSRRLRTELLILIRPRIVANDMDARNATVAWRNKLSSANSILSEGLGSPTHTLEDIFR